MKCTCARVTELYRCEERQVTDSVNCMYTIVLANGGIKVRWAMLRSLVDCDIQFIACCPKVAEVYTVIADLVATHPEIML